MKYTRLGRSGLEVSRIALGTMNFGRQTEASDAWRIMDDAHEFGINFFDTANVYGVDRFDNLASDSGRGRTEELIGEWFAGGAGRRERTVLATKLYNPMEDWPNSGRLSALAIRRQCDASLKRLRTDYIDLYQFHHIDRDTRWEEIWEAVEVLRMQGKVLYTGSSNFAGWHLALANSVAQHRNQLGLICEQSIYNLINRSIESELIPAAEHYGVSVLPWSPLHGGALAGAAPGMRRRDGRGADARRRNRAQLDDYQKLCAEIGHQPAGVALAWLLHQPAVAAPIVGPRTREHLAAAVAALDVELGPDALATLDQIFPGHQPAPEDYAW